MTRQQQIATRNLSAAEDAYLLAYGWRQDRRGWWHPRLPGTHETLRYTTADAVVETRGNTLLRLG